MTGWIASFASLVLLTIGMIMMVLPYLFAIAVPASIIYLVYRHYRKKREISLMEFMEENRVKKSDRSIYVVN